MSSRLTLPLLAFFVLAAPTVALAGERIRDRSPDDWLGVLSGLIGRRNNGLQPFIDPRRGLKVDVLLSHDKEPRRRTGVVWRWDNELDRAMEGINPFDHGRCPKRFDRHGLAHCTVDHISGYSGSVTLQKLPRGLRIVSIYSSECQY